ncbi:MAG: YkvA family protein [Cyclobacteriaceae bacterium]
MNRFFTSALRHATSIVGTPSRLLSLLPQLALKLRATNWKNVNAAAAKEKFFVLGRLVKAYALGQYREVPWKTILLIVAAIIYFVNPLDLIPDLIPLTGLTDDFAVLIWVYNSVSNEIDKFLLWEKTRIDQSSEK